jgi:hypothetical protein
LKCKGLLLAAVCAAVECTAAATAATEPPDLQAVVASMRACAAEQDDARRLACYDTQFKQSGMTPARAGRPPAAAPLAAPSAAAAPLAAAAPPPTLTPEQRFGLNPQLERKERGAAAVTTELDKLTSRIAAVSHKVRGEAVVTLENGQVWEQADADSRVVVKEGDAVSIRRGTLGSFWLSSPASAFRVRRVK